MPILYNLCVCLQSRLLGRLLGLYLYIRILCCDVDPQPLLMNYGVTKRILCLDADLYHLRVVTPLLSLVCVLYVCIDLLYYLAVC